MLRGGNGNTTPPISVVQTTSVSDGRSSSSSSTEPSSPRFTFTPTGLQRGGFSVVQLTKMDGHASIVGQPTYFGGMSPGALSDHHHNITHNHINRTTSTMRAPVKGQRWQWRSFDGPGLHKRSKPDDVSASQFKAAMTLALATETKRFKSDEATQPTPPSPIPLSEVSFSTTSSHSPVLNRRALSCVARAPACKSSRNENKRSSIASVGNRSDRSMSPTTSHTSEDLDATFVPVVVDGEQQPVKCTHCHKTYRQHNSYFKHLYEHHPFWEDVSTEFNLSKHSQVMLMQTAEVLLSLKRPQAYGDIPRVRF